MRVAGVLALGVGTVIIALVGGWSVMYRVSYVVWLLILLAAVWTLIGARSLAVERRVRTQRAQVGGHFEEWTAVDNTSWLPKPWLDLRIRSDISDDETRRGFVMGPKARRSWTIRTQCASRGKFRLGDIQLETGDPFGLFHRQVRFPSDETVVVYPRTVVFATAARIPGDLPGGAQQRGQVPFVTPTAAGVRDYMPGDPLSRIHWPSTARTGRFMVKEFELDPFSDVWVCLDLNRRVHHGRGPESTEEYAVTVAASLARHFLDENRAVGFVAQGEAVQPDRGVRQLSKVLELLAVLRADQWGSLAATLSGESLRFNRMSTLFVVTPSIEGDWVPVCQHLKQRGVHVLVALVESATFGSGMSSIDLVGSLAVASIPTYLVKRGEPIESLLAHPHPVSTVHASLRDS